MLESIRQLSFVDGADLWSVNPTGNWGADCETGRKCANTLMDLMSVEQAPNLLGSVTEAMIKKGAYGGIEVGFLQAIGELVVRARR